MKKLFYILLLTISTALTVTSCTEEEIAPATENTNSGGGSTQEGRL